ncbi:MAG TPA: nucleotidyl transferase AbiEii/AbiGii toxin family protein [Candidatus Dojkabacteria bacterium]|jgi:predicted nucleotidyltransferase component of viral defense system|nr:nucleotidyl transferase AbiEii/AbiGii toxin family protein [Candidatus Dojkabacteria bacterium]HPQ79478.1 nucleotidyl transferase AbiEii/AbiGii toxin family protein [Candidatus Dojkabacteria bacterium]HQA98814.1 nucleotidyl transferase AbiEii/AbiGii toxin family protein [Candidatus Dojkabacteria bacterium]
MFVPSNREIKHKNQLYILLKEILKDPLLSQNLMFKGGTYASLRGVLDRFSIDLDFDLPDRSKKEDIRKRCYEIFTKLELEIKDESKRHLQFFLKYDALEGERNTLKLEINDDVSKYNGYEKVLLEQINMYCNGHTLDTMFANKLFACKARYDKNGKIAGRDFYDIYKFFLQGLSINEKVIEERSGLEYVNYLKSLIAFIKKHLTKTLLNQDLNPLVKQRDLDKLLPHINEDIVSFLKDEISRINSQ